MKDLTQNAESARDMLVVLILLAEVERDSEPIPWTRTFEKSHPHICAGQQYFEVQYYCTENHKGVPDRSSSISLCCSPKIIVLYHVYSVMAVMAVAAR